MTRLINRALILLAVTLTSLTAYGQHWPQPSMSQNTDVTCPVGICTGKLVGYAPQFTKFVGRFLDSTTTNDYQQPVRTLRAGKLQLSPDGRRLYFIMGSMVAAYDKAKFFTRLTSGEQMVSVMNIPVAGWNVFPRPANFTETLLRPDRYFYAENGSGWQTPTVDTQGRLNDFDVDDQGYVYMSHFVFGWGIAKDDGASDGALNLMPSMFQNFPYEADPSQIVWFKNSRSEYFALVNSGVGCDIYNVTNRSAPTRVTTLSINFTSAVRNAAGDRVAILDGTTGKVNVWSSDTLGTGGAPLTSFTAASPFQYSVLGTDGTNFYAAYNFPNPTLKVAVFVPSGGSYAFRTLFDTGYPVSAGRLRAYDGYLTIGTTGSGALVYRIGSDSNFTEVKLPSSYAVAHPTTNFDKTLDQYTRQYYSGSAPPGYASPGNSAGLDVAVMKSGSKTYLVFCDSGLADVYEIQGTDGINLSSLGSVGTQNPNTPAAQRSQTFYGDPFGFTAGTTALSPMGITWNFGNPEAVSGADPNTLINQTGPATVTHRYSGISSAAGLAGRSLMVTNNADSSIFATVPVTMGAPSPRIGLQLDATHNVTFTATTASSSAPVVIGDQWFDASDGTVEGHSSSWSLYAGPTPTGTPAVTSLTPTQKEDVGQCGSHYVSFTGHYGQNAASFPASDYIVPAGGLGVGYTVRPFAAAVAVSASGSTLTFTNATRLTSDATTLTPAILAGLQFKWELLSAAGALQEAGPTGAYAAITPWTPHTTITRGMTVRLTISSPTDFSGVCAGLGYTSSAYITPPLNAPDPVINGTCTTAPCTFTAGSLSNVNPVTDGWSYAWGVSGHPELSGNAQTFSPAFTSSGQYTITLTATNAFGAAAATPKTVNVTVVLCQPFTPNVNVFIYYSAPSGCAAGNACRFGETITFSVGSFQYDLGCGPHTYSWSFGDGGTATGSTVTHSYASGSSYQVSCQVTDTTSQTTQTLTATVPLTSGGCVVNCGGGTGTGGCGTMSTANTFINYSTASNSCSATGGTCGTNETITFTASAFQYDFSCGTHTYSWVFGDGTTGSGALVNHAYSTANTYNVSLTIVGPTSSTVDTVSVKVGGGGGHCQTMVAGTNVFPRYTNTASTCTEIGGICAAGETLTFTASQFNYDFGCDTHTFQWTFGDGGTASGQQVTHAFANNNTYSVQLKITNSAQSVTMTVPVIVATTTKPPTAVDFTVTPWTANGVVIPNGYSFTPASTPSGSVTTFNWDFGDGTCPGAGAASCTSSGEIKHLFPTSANYTITLSVGVPSGYPGVLAVHPLVTVPPHRHSAPHN